MFDKLEQLVRDMQDNEHGVPVRSQKMFLTSIPAAFMGYDLIEWLMDRLSIEDSCKGSGQCSTENVLAFRPKSGRNSCFSSLSSCSLWNSLEDFSCLQL